MMLPTLPDSVLLLRAVAASRSEERGIFAHEMLLAQNLGWTTAHLVTVIAAGAKAGYIRSGGAGGVALNDKGRAWCAKHGEER